MTGPPQLLSVRDLAVTMRVGSSAVPVVAGLDLDVWPGEAVGLAGESGSGKTTTLRAILALLPSAGQITAGQVRFGGQDLVRASARELRQVRGRQIGIVWQDPLASLDPVMPAGAQIAEVVRTHEPLGRAAARDRVLELMRMVDLPDPPRSYRRYPHQLSGGQRQRVVIAAAIAAGPRLLLADEPTTALDVTVQDQVLTVLARLRAELGLALLLVTHDLAVISSSCDRVAVMYAGRIVETGPVGAVFAAPRHPYTSGLLAAAPSLTRPGELPRGIPGQPAFEVAASGCAFAPRCPRADQTCLAVTPRLTEVHPAADAAIEPGTAGPGMAGPTAVPGLGAVGGRAPAHLAACHHPLPARRDDGAVAGRG